eukprot:COSAG06_NODE_3447_length_5329_cov_5.060803_6_plen_62_part_00
MHPAPYRKRSVYVAEPVAALIGPLRLLVPMMVRVERFRAPYPDGAGSRGACVSYMGTNHTL